MGRGGAGDGRLVGEGREEELVVDVLQKGNERTGRERGKRRKRGRSGMADR